MKAMKTSSHPSFFHAGLALVMSIVALFTFSGCASMDASNQRSLLAASGFRERTPETAKQRELYDAAPSYKVQRISAEGRVFYAYKDEKHGVAFVGGEDEYQRYQKLALEQKIASDNYMAAEMNRTAAMGWYGAYGSYAFGHYGRLGPVGRFR